jgi:serine protease AprX
MEQNSMKKAITSLFFFLILQSLIAQSTAAYWIFFTDKKNSPYSINEPSVYLSEKAIDRRHKQNIPVTTSDLPINSSYINAIRSFDVTILNQSKWFNAVLVSCADVNKIKEIKKLACVKEVKTIMTSAAANGSSKFESESSATSEPEERSVIAAPTTVLNYGPSYYQAHQIGVDCLHDLGFQGQGMVIAELDAGFEKVDVLPAFDSLRMNNQLLGTHDFVLGGTVLYQGHPHGMNTLSCMVANLPGSLVGTAPKAKYWLLRTEDAATESLQEEINWLSGAEFADSVGADVINSSLGYNTFDNTADNHKYSDLDGNTTIITKAADMAASKGIFVVSSAGNAGGPPWYKITAPADADSILTIGAVDSAGVITSFSSRGLTFDGRVKPNTVARGGKAVVASQNGGTFKQSGTSFSSPITAGAVACLWQANPTHTNMEILDAIQQSASKYTTPDSVMGYGIPDFCMANTLLSGIDVHPLNEEEKLTVYPNPFKNSFNIGFYSDKKQTIRFEIIDISGRIIFKEEERTVNANSTSTFNFADGKTLSPGVYILRMITPVKVYYKKLVRE